MTDEELKQMNAVYDNPKDTDFLWSEYCEWLENTTKFPWRQLKVRNQYDQKETYKACSCYGATAIFNWNQIIEFWKQGIEFEQENPRWKRLAFQAERWYPNSWASLQDIMSFFKKRWLIDWYVKCKTAQECKNAMNNWYGIYTWSSKCSWSKTNKSKQFVYDANWANHCFAVADFDEDWLRAINSFGEKRWDNGRFYIPNDNFNDLFSCYALVDHDDTWKIEGMIYNMEYNKAIELWITNWTRPDDNVTRKECAVMSYRVYKKLCN